ncbi:hypothetical protein MMYC01_204599 [Madurella mycetomatis]|uniref:Uncharacterized protein n=1 Tax=Madurella mycetomatis TaxID=100816 RepID=A0A175W9N8_9PEZI|nr:hypothetical protein MMYC01_204599 [Madurella mycetomatis]
MGLVKLLITPWSTSAYTTPDIWVVSPGEHVTDQPIVREKNTIYTLVRNSGAMAVADVQTTIYAIEPPEVRDNGFWAPAWRLHRR